MANEMPERVVRLSINAEGFAVPDQDPVEVNRHNQKIRWCASFPFEIDIDSYKDVKYTEKGAGNGDPYNCTSGYFTGQSHKYSIIANGLTNDPEIVVKP